MNGYIGTKAQAVRLDTYTKQQVDDMLAAQASATNTALQTLDGKLDSVTIYPNGGTEASPATVAINSRYMENNPFPGHRVFCECKVYLGGVWYRVLFLENGADSYGVAAAHVEEIDKIEIVTGKTYLLVPGSAVTAQAIPLYTGANITSPLWCKVIVRKLKGAI